MFKCPNCGRVYKNNGKWILKHMIEVCHAKSLKPIELVEKQDVELHDILNRINGLESMIKNIKIAPNYHDNPIERIKEEEAQKITDPLIAQYRTEFGQCIKDLQEMIRKGVQLNAPKEYEPEVTEEMAYRKLQEINKKNLEKQLQLQLMRD